MILSEQYNVIPAERGEMTPQMVGSGKTPVDLILIDLMMPVMDGYTLLKNLKSGDTTRYIPVIMLTARADPADRSTPCALVWMIT